jgi:hypothetical protein
MKPILPTLQQQTVDNYKGEMLTIKLFDQKSLEIHHEDATFINAFALRFSGDKENGTYVEVGASHWRDGNNTYMLEKEFGWTGVGLEIEQHYVDEYNKNRSNPCVQGDATTFNWDKYFEENNFPKQIDHLSIDTDFVNLLSLINMPLSRYRFSTIVVENKESSNQALDIDEKVKKTQREILARYNYTLIGSGYTDDFWIDHNYLKLMGNQWDSLSAAMWHGNIQF